MLVSQTYDINTRSQQVGNVGNVDRGDRALKVQGQAQSVRYDNNSQYQQAVTTNAELKAEL